MNAPARRRLPSRVGREGGAVVRHYAIDPDRSTIVVEARSSVGPITWEGVGPTGEFAIPAGDDAAGDVSGGLELNLSQLTSGNPTYDAELHRRVDSRRHPVARVVLTEARRVDDPGRYRARGSLEFHGVRRPVAGELELTRRADGTVVVTGMQRVDIRDFGFPAPTMLMLKVYPDVQVHLVVEGTPVA